MKTLFYAMSLLAAPSISNAGVDFTSTIQNNAMLILFLMCTLCSAGAIVIKIFWDKMEKRIQDSTKASEDNEEKAWNAELRLKQQEAQQLKDRVDRIESDHNLCNRSMPTIYVTKAEYNTFIEQYRTDSNQMWLTLKQEIKELKNELKSDVQEQIDRIVGLLNDAIKK